MRSSVGWWMSYLDSVPIPRSAFVFRLHDVLVQGPQPPLLPCAPSSHSNVSKLLKRFVRHTDVQSCWLVRASFNPHPRIKNEFGPAGLGEPRMPSRHRPDTLPPLLYPACAPLPRDVVVFPNPRHPPANNSDIWPRRASFNSTPTPPSTLSDVLPMLSRGIAAPRPVMPHARLVNDEWPDSA